MSKWNFLTNVVASSSVTGHLTNADFNIDVFGF